MNRSSHISVVVADSQYLTRKAIAAIIEDMPCFQLKAQLGCLKELELRIPALQPDFLILEGKATNRDFPEKIKNIQNSFDSKILVVTAQQDPDFIRSVIKLGVNGIIAKDCSESEISNALNTVSAGHRFYSSSFLDLFMEKEQVSDEGTANLSPRELQVLQFIAQGQTTKTIAANLHISIHTVNSHRKNILRKLDVSSPIHLVTYAVEKGIVNVDYDRK